MDGQALVPVTESRARMESFLADVLPPAVTIGTTTVPPTTFDDGHRTTAMPMGMATATPTASAPSRGRAVSDDATLEALRLADSFLPVATYSVSSGLEQFVAEDRVEGADDLAALLGTYLSRQLGPADLVALRVAHRAALAGDLEGICGADCRLTETTLAAESRTSAAHSGERLLTLQRDNRDRDLLERYAAAVAEGEAPGNYPVVLGVATGLAGVDEREACLLACHGFVTGLLGAAQRLLSLGHTEAQRIFDALRPAMTAAIDDSVGRSLDEMTPFAPLVDVLAADHERADRRLFASQRAPWRVTRSSTPRWAPAPPRQGPSPARG